jgi:hypothetical protein
MDGPNVKSTVTRDYKIQLREQWHEAADSMERHKHSRMYLGRPMELFVAQDLEISVAVILDLEATGANCDVVLSIGTRLFFVEVKFIGTADSSFFAIEESLTKGGISIGMNDPYSASDYLLSRLLEAAKQLEKQNDGRIAVAVIDDYTSWPVFGFVLEHGLIDFEKPQFFRRSQESKTHLDKLQKKHPNLDQELFRLPTMLDEILIYRLKEGFELELKKKLSGGRKPMNLKWT